VSGRVRALLCLTSATRDYDDGAKWLIGAAAVAVIFAAGVYTAHTLMTHPSSPSHLAALSHSHSPSPSPICTPATPVCTPATHGITGPAPQAPSWCSLL
jgi:hypothetical protein